MKRNALPFVFFSLLCGAGAYAQEFSQEPVPQDAYALPKTNQPANRQKVQEVYQTLSNVHTLDFTGAVRKSVSAEITAAADKVVDKAGYVTYNNRKAIDELFAAKPEALTVELPFKGGVLVADLVRANLFGDDFKVSASDPSLVEDIKIGLYYQGTLRGTNAVVTFSFFENEFSALITNEQAANSIIEAGLMRTSDNSEATHIVYADDDLKVVFGKPCEAESLDQYNEALEKISKVPIPQGDEKALLKCVTYFWETSYNMYQQFGTTQAVTNYMTNLFNNFQIIYNNESIGSKLNQLYIWTTADSYNNDLNTFSSNRSGFGANLATLFSTTGGGGVAWLDILCGSNEYYKHGFCGSVGGSFPAVPNYSWPVNVSTHEVGHNLGSPHTHACSWTGGAIDGCGPTAGYSEGCTAALPAGGGTIMSYCHLLSTGINFNNGFGPQPGNLIRSRVNSCITLTCETNGGGGGSCASSYEPNESMGAAATIPAGPTLSAAISTGTDNDYFKFVTGTTTNNVINLVGPGGVDFDLQVYNSGGTLVGSSTSASATETVTLNAQAAGTYYVRVYGYNGANSATCYTIKVTATSTACGTAYEPNETLAAAIALTTGSTINAAITTTTDNDYYKITTTATANNSYVLAGPSGVDFDLQVYNSGGTLLGSSTSGSANETVTLNGQAAGTYYIRVYGYNGANSATCYSFSTASAALNVMAAAPMTIEEADDLTIWPNPTNDKINLGGTYAGKLVNQLGQTVMEFNGSELSLKELQSGVYLLQVEGSSKLYRVIKE